MFDITQKLGNCTIHHGKANNRIYLMEYDTKDQNIIIDRLESLANKNEYGKIVLKIPEHVRKIFLDRGYHAEGKIQRYYQGKGNCIFLSKFLSPERGNADNESLLKKNIEIALTKIQNPLASLHSDFTIRKMDSRNASAMASLYKRVFRTYPFPIFNPNYIIKTMKTNVVYFGIYFGKELVALSSSEMNINYENAEMTDFAINPEYRGNQLAKHLLLAMESEMKNRGIKTLYTIARSESLPMNCTFAGLGYIFGGTLINNTQISGKIESMNIWYK